MIAISLILFLPANSGTLKDGGTRVYGAIAYKVVKWKHMYTESIDANGVPVIKLYEKKVVYWFPDSIKSIDELWEIEQKNVDVRE